MSLSYEDALAKIRDRSFGGADIAAAPLSNADLEEDDFFPVGPYLGGAAGLADWFRDQLLNGRGFCAGLILVGAPGNGKSFISQAITRGLSSEHTTDNLHRRRYVYRTPTGSRLVVINDATIPPNTAEGEGFLVDEIELAIRNGHSLLVNVNRGVLYDELRRSDSSSAGSTVVDWVSGGTKWTSSTNSILIDIDPELDSSVRLANIRMVDQTPYRLCSVYMDGCSLFEPNIHSDFSSTEVANFPRLAAPYEVLRFNERSIEDTALTAGGELIESFANKFPQSSQIFVDMLHPIEANLNALRDPAIRTGITKILRAAEIATSSHFTYRELWGAISLSILGPELCSPVKDVESENSDVVKWISHLQPEAQRGKSRLKSLIRLASARLHQALFGAIPPERLSDVFALKSSNPTVALTSVIDPVRDALSGHTSDRGWASPVYDAFSSRVEGGSILSDLLALIPADDPLNRYVTEFDHTLDVAVCAALEDSRTWLENNETDRRVLLAWYSEYLLRMYAICHGHPAFEDEINEWTNVWAFAKTGNVTHRVEQGFRTLLLPKFESEQFSLLPLFDSRIEPLEKEPMEPRLVLAFTNPLGVNAHAQDDYVFIEVQSPSSFGAQQSTINLMLDFDLLRECLACSTNSSGYTDKNSITTPRIERFRSALLRGGQGQNLLVVARGTQEQLTLARPEEVYR